jgi:hypothetical protein
MRGLAVGTAVGTATGGPGIIVTAPGAVAVNVLGGVAVGSIACMSAANTNAGGQNNGDGSGRGSFWKRLKSFRGKTKTNGLSGSARRYFEWDYTHGDVEVYDSMGRHLGSADPETGLMTKPPVPGRKIVI